MYCGPLIRSGIRRYQSRSDVKNEEGHMDSFIPAHEQAIRLVLSLNMSNSLAFFKVALNC